MRVLAVADTRPDPPISHWLTQQPQLIILLGDLHYNWLTELQHSKIPVMGVYGNHCDGHYLSKLGAINLHSVAYEYGGLRFGGLEGAPQYKPHGSKLLSEADVAQALLALPSDIDVLVTHTPPRGVNDDPSDMAHHGFMQLRNFVLANKPRHLLHGHTYPDPVQSQFAETTIHYVNGAQMLDLE